MATITIFPKLGLLLSSYIVYKYMQKHGAPNNQWLRTLTKHHNNTYALFSLLLCLALLHLQLERLLGHAHGTWFEEEETLAWVFHWSKYYEFIDILLYVASNRIPNVQFAVHHATTPDLTASLPMTGWKIPAIVNTFHHVLLYVRVGSLLPGSVERIVSAAIPFTAVSQVLVGVVGEIVVLNGWGGLSAGEEGRMPHWRALGLLVWYAVSFASDVFNWNADAKVRQGEEDVKVKGRE